MSVGPFKVDTLAAFLPHRPPMVWLDEVVRADKDGGTCAVTLKPDGLYRDAAGALLTFAPVEWMAQAYGYARSAHERTQGAQRGASLAFLVGVTDLVLSPTPAPASGRILVDVKLAREMLPLALVDGVVRVDGGEVLARARLKLYFEY